MWWFAPYSLVQFPLKIPARKSSQSTRWVFLCSITSSTYCMPATTSLGSSRPEEYFESGRCLRFTSRSDQILAGSSRQHSHATHGGILVSAQYGTHVRTILLIHSQWGGNQS